jgi:hypothetical protein
MNSFSMLEASIPDQKETWLHLWKSWPEREVSAHPNYASLFASPGDRVLCATFVKSNGGILFPLILRPLQREPWAPAGCLWWDATSPYGYGGPYCWNCTPAEVQDFWSQLRHWAEKQKVVSLFARLSLFSEQLAQFDGQVEEIMPNVVRVLDLSPEELWADYKKGLRKSIKHALKANVLVVADPDGNRLREFIEVYHDTMVRRAAVDFYRFAPDFFERIKDDLPGQFILFHAVCNGKIVASELTLLSAKYLYSFLGGSTTEGLKSEANSLLMHEIALWGIRMGKKCYVLGGGYGEADTIFFFKSRFAPRGIVPFRTGQILYDQSAYQKLLEARSAWESARGNSWRPRPRFFPAYRA